MTDHPIIFSPPMIRALIEGRKMQTRRLIKPQPELAAGEYINECHYCKTRFAVWKPDGSCSCNPVKGIRFWFGDRLWVRENYEIEPDGAGLVRIIYRAGGERMLITTDESIIKHADALWTEPDECRPSIHMPRWASRLTLTVTDVRVQRLQEISEEDAEAEGWPFAGRQKDVPLKDAYPIGWYAWLWDSLHGERAWDANPWIVALTFTVAHGNIDALPKQMAA